MSLEFDPSNPLRVKRAHDDDESENEELVDDISNDVKRKKDRTVGALEYDEDSSEEDSSSEEGGEKPKKKEKKDDDSDDDMFASDDEKEAEDTVKKHKSRTIKTMDIDQFKKENDLDDFEEDDEEKDTYFAHETKHTSDDDDDDDEDEEERPDDYYLDPETEHYIKPRKGPKMDSFSLKNETETGVFDENGNYYEAAESDDDEAWQDLKKKEIKKAKLAQEEMEKKQKLKNSERDNVDVGEVLGKLITLLQPVENVMEALARLNKLRVKVKRRGGKKTELTEEQKDTEKTTQKSITDLTEYSELLVVNGFKDIYDLEREELMLKYKDETGKAYPREKKQNNPVNADVSQQQAADQQRTEAKDWEFRWVGDTQVNGPYSRREILYWKDNYFNGHAEVRKVGEEKFIHISEATI